MYKNKSLFLKVIGTIILCFFYSTADAHDIPVSEIKIVPDESQLHLELKLNVFELRFISEIDQNNNDKIEREEFEEKREVIKQRLLESLKIEIGDVAVGAAASGIKWDVSSHHLLFRVHYPVENQTTSLKLTSKLQKVTSQSHITWVTYYSSDDRQRAKLDVRMNSVTFELAKNPDRMLETFFSIGEIIVLGIGFLLIAGVFYRFIRSDFFPYH